jgi:hypothetical protein
MRKIFLALSVVALTAGPALARGDHQQGTSNSNRNSNTNVNLSANANINVNSTHVDVDVRSGGESR